MRRLPKDFASQPVAHDRAWWRYAFLAFMRGPNSWAVGGLILLVGATGGGVVRILGGEALTGVGLLVIGFLGIAAFAAHFEREYMIGYINDRNELIRDQDDPPGDRA